MNSQIDAAIKVLNSGGIILYPTDTIWGIGCDATNKEAVAKVYEIKKRENNRSLIVLAADADMVCKYVKEMPEIAISLIEVGDKPMTIIYPNAIGLAENLLGEDNSIGIRVPMSEFCKKLITRFKKPIVSTSANISGEEAPLYYEDISNEIRNSVNLVIAPEMEDFATHAPSSIIKVGMRSEIEIIRD